MDFNNGNDGEKLFEQRNESSVLFSLDSLAQVSESASESERGVGGSGDESGLIDLNTLTAMSTSDQQNDDFGGAPVFNSVKSKSAKRKTGIMIAAVVFAVLAVVVGGYLAYKHFEEVKAAKDAEIAKLQEEEKAAQAKKDAEINKLRQEKEQLESDAKEREADAKKLADAKAKEEAAKQKAAEETAKEDSKSTRRGSSSSASANPKDSDSGSAPKAAASTSGGGKPLTADQVKSALQGAANDVGKGAKNGNLIVTMKVSPDGTPKNITAESGSFKGTSTEKCILTKVSKIRFPASGKGADGVRWNFKL